MEIVGLVGVLSLFLFLYIIDFYNYEPLKSLISGEDLESTSWFLI